MKYVKELLQSGSSVSTMRFMSVICILNAIIISIIGVCKHQPDYSGISMLCSAFLAAGFTGKVAQKRIETANILKKTK